MSLRQEIREGRLRDDYDVLEYSREANRRLKMQSPLFQGIHSEVKMVGRGFAINPKLEIMVAKLSIVLQEKKVPTESLPAIYEAGVLHENMHVTGFPFMTRMNETYAIIHKYMKERVGRPLVEPIFHNVENIISDIFNELVAYEKDLPFSSVLPELRYHYVAKHEKIPDRSKLEAADPLSALFHAHNTAFTRLYERSTYTPRFGKPVWKSEVVYNKIYDAARDFDPDWHTETLNVGRFTLYVTSPLVNAGIFDAMDKMYEWLKSTPVKPSSRDRKKLDNILNIRLVANLPYLRPYWSYFVILAAYYRLVEELFQVSQVTPACFNQMPDQARRPEIPDPDVLDSIFGNIVSQEENLVNHIPPELAEYAAKKILSNTLLVPGFTHIEKSEVEQIKLPFYKRPRGKLDPFSVVAGSGFLDWKVVTKSTYTGYERVSLSTGAPPRNMTILIDVSGSTTEHSSILSPIIGIDAMVLDVERVTAMAMLHHIINAGGVNADVNLIPFADAPVGKRMKVPEAYDTLKHVEKMAELAGEVFYGGTSIVRAVDYAIKRHKDGPKNPFILMTDLEIEPYEEATITKMILEGLKFSPVLVVVIGHAGLRALNQLNMYRNSAAVVVSSFSDYPNLEEAIAKVSRAIRGK